MKKIITLTHCLLVCTLFGSVSYGQIAQNLTMANAKAVAFANAVTADPPGIDAIHFNPAGLAKLKGRQYELKFVAASFTIGGNLSRSEKYQELLDYSDMEDPIDDSYSETSTVALMLPGMGLTEMPVLAAPLGGVAYNPPGTNITFATSVYAPLAAGYSRGKGDPQRYQGNSLGITRIAFFAPSVGYQINEKWSVGASIGFSYSGVGIDLDMRVPNELLVGVDIIAKGFCEGDLSQTPIGQIVNLCQGTLGPFTDIGNLLAEMEKPLSITYNLGVLWEVSDWLTWGATYQSGAPDKVKGDFTFDYSDDWELFFKGLQSTSFGDALVDSFELPVGLSEQSGQASLKLALPQHFSTGIMLQLTPRWQMNLDVKWTDTAAWQEFRIEFDQTLDFLSILKRLAPQYITESSITFPRGYESTWSWAVGFEYQYSPNLALRLGYEDRPSAIPNDKSDLLAPFGAAYFVGSGFSYQKNKNALFELSIGMLASDVSIPSDSSSNVNLIDANNIVYNPYAGYDIETSVRAYLIELSYRTQF